MSLFSRAWEKVKIIPFGCWEFQGRLNDQGYGLIGDLGDLPRKSYRVHRVVYEHFREDLKEDLVLDHLCRNRKCCNPWHLEEVTQTENVRRGISPSALNIPKTHCCNGHEFNNQNTYKVELTNKNGTVRYKRHCRACDADRKRKKYERRKDFARSNH